MYVKTITLKFADHTETVVVTGSLNDCARQIDAMIVSRGAIGFGTQSTVYCRGSR